MKIYDMLLSLPKSFLAKFVREDLSEGIKERAVSEGLYHFTSDESADKIIESQYIKPSKAFTAYGKPCAFMFCGKPDLDSYFINVIQTDVKKNPYAYPDKVSTAVMIKPPNKESLNRYKYRSMSDEAVMCEGYCVLPKDCARKVQLVLDLARDENGTPLKNENGENYIEFREADKYEIIPGTDTYAAQDDYLNFMREQAIKKGYIKGQNIVSDVVNATVSSVYQLGAEARKATNDRFRLPNIINMFKERFKKKSLDESTENLIRGFNFGKKNPYRDKKFSQKIASIQAKDGIMQDSLEEVLDGFKGTEDADFFLKKFPKTISSITRGGIHGKDHATRVALLASIIANREGVFKGEDSQKMQDILITASTLHDIGRIFDVGPHATRGANIIKDMYLTYADGTEYSKEDKALVMALVDSHEGKPDKIYKSIQKYGILNKNYVNYALALNNVLRDADALDRVRLDNNLVGYNANLNPDYLTTISGKALINAAYGLEFLTNRGKTVEDILGRRKETYIENSGDAWKVEKDELKPLETHTQDQTIEREETER